jgi:hypothetical protein
MVCQTINCHFRPSAKSEDFHHSQSHHHQTLTTTFDGLSIWPGSFSQSDHQILYTRARDGLKEVGCDGDNEPSSGASAVAR